MKKIKKINIFIAGHQGMVGSAVLRHLKKYKKYNIIAKERKELDLTNQAAVDTFFNSHKIDQIYICAAKVGGIHANQSKPASFLYENLMVETNIINSAFKNKIPKLLFLGSSCIYPKYSKNPITEDQLLKGILEPTNEAYAIAKIAGVKLCQFYTEQYGNHYNIDYRSAMPTNLYGINDTYDLQESHVIPALILKFHLAKVNNYPNVNVWGTGKAKREFIDVDDLAKALHLLMKVPKKIFLKNSKNLNFLNIGSGKDISIYQLSLIVKKIIGYNGNIIFDHSKPDGIKRKLLDVKKINKLGWKTTIKIEDGLKVAYDDFLNNYEISKDQNKAIKKIKEIKSKKNKFTHPLVRSSWDHKEESALSKVINSNQFTMGKTVKTFEKKFSKFIKSKYAIMVNSGSSANLLMVASLFFKKNRPLKRGDEVIVPAVSWSTTYFPLYQYGLKVVFVDIDKKTLVMDTEQLKKAISPKTRLILAVNLLGNSNNYSEIKKIIGKKNIYLIEDSCQAMGTKYKEKYCGTFGIMGSFSSFFSHHINTMEGGIIVTEDEEIYQILLSLRAHGWIRDLPNKNYVMNKTGNVFKDTFSFALPGYNLRPLEFSAALGIEQLKKLPKILKIRRKNFTYLQKIFKNHPDIYLQQELGESSWFGFSLIINQTSRLKKNELLNKLNLLGFETRPISAGNFAKNKVVNLFNYRIVGSLDNAKYIDKYGIYIGNNHVDSEKIFENFKKI